jgi:hypothetical protein
MLDFSFLFSLLFFRFLKNSACKYHPQHRTTATPAPPVPAPQGL